MTLLEMAPQYRLTAVRIRERIADLNARRRSPAVSKTEKLLIARRIAVLQTMYGETVEAAAVMEQYYDRRAKRNVSLTV